MARKIIGTILVMAGGTLAVALFANGMLVFPHIIGPSILAVAGVIVLAVKRNTGNSIH